MQLLICRGTSFNSWLNIGNSERPMGKRHWKSKTVSVLMSTLPALWHPRWWRLSFENYLQSFNGTRFITSVILHRTLVILSTSQIIVNIFVKELTDCMCDSCDPSFLESWGKRIKSLRPVWTTKRAQRKTSNSVSKQNKK